MLTPLLLVVSNDAEENFQILQSFCNARRMQHSVFVL